MYANVNVQNRIAQLMADCNIAMVTCILTLPSAFSIEITCAFTANRWVKMIDRQPIEMTLIRIARQKGEPLDGHALYTIRTGVTQALQAKELYRQRMTVTDYQWKKPAAKR